MEEEKKENSFYKKWWFWVIIFLVVMAIIGANSNNNETAQTTSNDTENKTINTVKQETEEEKQARLEKERIEKEQKEAEEKAKKEQEESSFKASCQNYTFEQLARNPENFKGTNVKLTGEVVQVMEGLYSNSLRVNITKEGTYTTYYKDTIYVNYVPKEGEDKILEEDIITIYGTAQGDYSYTSTLGATITLPFVDGKYITIEK